MNGTAKRKIKSRRGWSSEKVREAEKLVEDGRDEHLRVNGGAKAAHDRGENQIRGRAGQEGGSREVEKKTHKRISCRKEKRNGFLTS